MAPNLEAIPTHFVEPTSHLIFKNLKMFYKNMIWKTVINSLIMFKSFKNSNWNIKKKIYKWAQI